MFKSVVALNESEQFPTFAEAFKKFWTDVRAMGATSLQVIETACWIETTIEGTDRPTIMGFYDARDFAYGVGLLNDGVLVDPAPEIPTEVITNMFAACAIGNIRFMLNELLEKLEPLARNASDASEGSSANLN